MDVIIVGIMVGIDEHRLSGLTIAHLLHIAPGKADQLFMGHLMAFTGESDMKLRLLNTCILSGIVIQEGYQVFGRVFSHVADIAEVEHLHKFGFPLSDLALIVFYSMEIGTGWKDGCYHIMQFI
jgi:hypothetical protein